MTSDDIILAYPNMFPLNFYFQCDSGWYNIISNLCKTIEPILPRGFIVTQIKEKFGGLRFYYRYDPIDENDLITLENLTVIRALVTYAENMADTTCEICGACGKTYAVNYVMKTVCVKHQQMIGMQND